MATLSDAQATFFFAMLLMGFVSLSGAAIGRAYRGGFRGAVYGMAVAFFLVVAVLAALYALWHLAILIAP